MPAWMRNTLALAALYYIALGVSAIVWPQSWYIVSGLSPVNAEVVMAALGAALLAFGAAALLSVFLSRSQWSLVLIVLLHNVFDFFIVCSEISAGRLGRIAGVGFALVDIGWIIAFTAVLAALYRRALTADAAPVPLEEALKLRPIGSEKTLSQLSSERPLLLIAVRHSGCTFCRSHLAAVTAEHAAILEKGFSVVVASMDTPDRIEALRRDFPLPDALFVSDPDKRLYRALGAKRASFGRLFGARELWRGLFRGDVVRYGLGEVTADPAQLGGTFIIKNNSVVFAEPAKSASDICPIAAALEAAPKA